jgi:hypothetical protein
MEMAGNFGKGWGGFGQAAANKRASFSKEDEMPVVGRKYHIACHGAFRVEDGTGIVDPKK